MCIRDRIRSSVAATGAFIAALSIVVSVKRSQATAAFGIGTACYAPGFNLTCNTSSYPPKLLLTARSADYRILTISPTGTLTVTSPIASDCTNDDDTNLIATINLKSTPYTLSYSRNRFTAIGCAAIGLMVQAPAVTSSGCYSQCLERDDVVAGLLEERVQ